MATSPFAESQFDLQRTLMGLTGLYQDKQREVRKQQEQQVQAQLNQANMAFKFMSDKNLPDALHLKGYNMLRESGLFSDMPEMEQWQDRYTNVAKKGGGVLQSFIKGEYDWDTLQQSLGELYSESQDERDQKLLEGIRKQASSINEERMTKSAKEQLSKLGDPNKAPREQLIGVLGMLPKDSPLTNVLQAYIKKEEGMSAGEYREQMLEQRRFEQSERNKDRDLAREQTKALRRESISSRKEKSEKVSKPTYRIIEDEETGQKMRLNVNTLEQVPLSKPVSDKTLRSVTPGVEFLKRAKDSSDAQERIRDLAKKGWSQTELTDMVRKSGWGK